MAKKSSAPTTGETTFPISEITPAEFMASAKPLRVEGTGAILVPTLFRGGESAGYRLQLASYAIPVGDKLIAAFGSANLTVVKPNGKPVVPAPFKPKRVEVITEETVSQS